MAFCKIGLTLGLSNGLLRTHPPTTIKLSIVNTQLLALALAQAQALVLLKVEHVSTILNLSPVSYTHLTLPTILLV